MAKLHQLGHRVNFGPQSCPLWRPLFASVISQWLVAWHCRQLRLLHDYSMVLASTDNACGNHLLSGSQNGDLANSPILSIFINWHSSVKELTPSHPFTLLRIITQRLKKYIDRVLYSLLVIILLITNGSYCASGTPHCILAWEGAHAHVVFYWPWTLQSATCPQGLCSFHWAWWFQMNDLIYFKPSWVYLYHFVWSSLTNCAECRTPLTNMHLRLKH